MKTLLDATNNMTEIITQFNDYEYPAGLALICMCVEEYCLAHGLNATKTFEKMLEINRSAVATLGVYGHEEEDK